MLLDRDLPNQSQWKVKDRGEKEKANRVKSNQNEGRSNTIWQNKI